MSPVCGCPGWLSWTVAWPVGSLAYRPWRGGICECVVRPDRAPGVAPGSGEVSLWLLPHAGLAPESGAAIENGACRCTPAVARLLANSTRQQLKGSSGFERLVPVSSTDYSASTSGLSTWWSSTALDETWF